MRATNFAAIKAKMGCWEYYLCRMPFLEAVEYLKFSEEVQPKPELDELLQRELTKRSSEIAEFLQNNDERFFGSLIVAVIGGSPRFKTIEIEGAELLGNVLGTVGILIFDGKENYYVLDGQHRLAAMREVATKNQTRYEKDDVSIILVSNPKTSEGIQRARRLFTNVNRYATKTSKATNIALDEDDPIAILTRRLVRESEYFSSVIKIAKRDPQGKTILIKGEALQIGIDKGTLMTLATLYECNQSLLSGHKAVTSCQKQCRPDEAILEDAWTVLNSRWELMLKGIDDFGWTHTQRVFNRNRQDGGSLVARPIAQKAICMAAGKALSNGISSEIIINAIKRVPILSKAPWRGLLWNPEDGTMFARKERMELAANILCSWMGLKMDIEKIKERLRIVTSDAAKLPA